MTYFLLLLVSLVCAVSSYACFTDKVRQGGLFLPLMVAVSVATGFLFAFGCRLVDDKPKIIIFSLYYDCCVAAAYYILPLLFFGVHLRPGVIVGSAIVVVGLLVVHWGAGP